MADDESSVSNRMNKEPETLELSPWLHERLEKRARPLASQGLPQLHNGGRLTTLVTKHTGISDVISRVGRLTFLSNAYRGILRKVGRTETPELYRMLDLPWFRPHNVSGRDIIGERSMDERLEKTDSLDRKTSSRTDLQKTLISSDKIPSASRTEKHVIERRTSPDAFITTLTSPPVSRKVMPSIGNGVGRPIVAKQTSPQTGVVNRLDMPVSNQVTGGENSSQILRTQTKKQQLNKNTIRTSNENAALETHKRSNIYGIEQRQKGIDAPRTLNKKEIQKDTGTKSQEINVPRANINTGDISQQPDETKLPEIIDDNTRISSNVVGPEGTGVDKRYGNPNNHSESITKPMRSELQLKSIQPLSLSLATTEKKGDAQKTGADSEIVKAVREPGGEAGLDVRHQANETSKLTQSSAQDTSESRTTNLENRSDLQRKEASQIYPAQELVHKKSLSIGQKIIRALPLIKNIKHKDDNVAPTPVTKGDNSEQENSSLSLTKIDMVHAPTDPKIQESPRMSDGSESPRVTSDAQAAPSSAPENNIKSTENATGEVPKERRVAVREKINKKAVSQIYPAKDLIFDKPRILSRHIFRALPLGRNWNKIDLVPHPALRTFEPPNVSIGNQPTGENEEIPGMKGITNYFSQPAVQTPLSRANDKNNISMSRYNITQNKLGAFPDLTSPSVNKQIDLVLAPVSQPVDKAYQRENHQQLDQPVQRTQSSGITQPAMRTKTEQTQDTTQTTATQPVENEANQNNNQPDIRALAREVYPFIKRMLIIERERRPSP